VQVFSFGSSKKKVVLQVETANPKMNVDIPIAERRSQIQFEFTSIVSLRYYPPMDEPLISSKKKASAGVPTTNRNRTARWHR